MGQACDTASRKTAGPTHYRLNYSGPKKVIQPSIKQWSSAITTIISSLKEIITYISKHRPELSSLLQLIQLRIHALNMNCAECNWHKFRHNISKEKRKSHLDWFRYLQDDMHGIFSWTPMTLNKDHSGIMTEFSCEYHYSTCDTDQLTNIRTHGKATVISKSMLTLSGLKMSRLDCSDRTDGRTCITTQINM